MIRDLTARLTGTVQAVVKAHLDWIYRITTAYPLRVTAVSLALLALAVVSIVRTPFESDIFKLFPSQKGALRLFIDSLEWSGSAREAYFLLEGEPRRLVPEAEAFAARLKGLKVDGKPAFAKVTYRMYDPAESNAFTSFIGYAVTHPQFFLPPEEVVNFVAALSPAAMDISLRRARTELSSQIGMAMRDIIAVDPLYLRDLMLPRLKQGSQALNLDPASPYFLSRDGQALIIIAEPARPIQDMVFARKLVAGINDARQSAKVKVSCAGAHLSAVIDEAVMKQNVIACILSSLVVVLGLFYLTYRRFLPTLLIPFILFCGVTLSLGVAGLFVSSIHIISFAFTSLIIGLGTDYSIHLYDRFYTERCAGRETAEALRLAMVDTGHGVFTAAFTTALPFLALAMSDVRALSELGILVGLGVIFSLYATFFFLPPLLLFSERRFPRSVYRPLPGFGLGALWDFTKHRCRLVATMTSVLIVFLAMAACFVSFEGELKNLQPRHSEAFLTQEKIERHLSLSPKQLIVAVEGASFTELHDRASNVERLVERYQQDGKIDAFSSLGQLVNDRQRQREIERRVGALSPDRALRAALERNGFDPVLFTAAIDGLAGLKNLQQIPDTEGVARLAASPLRSVVERHLVMDRDGRCHLLFYLHYRDGKFRPEAFLQELATADPQARATSVDLVSSQLAASVKRSFAWGILLGSILVLFLLVAHFDSLAGVLSSLLPVFAGAIAMIGTMTLTGIRINFMNAMVFVTILGMGSDYGLHIYHRTGGRTDETEREVFVQAGRAVLLSALTTIAGFGSLAFTDYGAMSSIGWATNYGIGATSLMALVALPAFMHLSARR